MAPRVSIVEDDSRLRTALETGLVQAGFDVTTAATGSELLDRVRQAAPDVVVIDIGLPDSDGRDVCQALRAHGVNSPVLFLTARSNLADRLAGFHAGGDDYLVKPFAFKELVVRLRALVRRQGSGEVRWGGLALDPAAHGVTHDGAEVLLTPIEFRLLASLAGRGGEVVRRHELIASGWTDGAMVQDNTLDTYMARLRRKLRSIGRDGAITTVHGVGYRLT